MTIYGFKDKIVAEKLKAFAKSKLEDTTRATYPKSIDNGSRIFIVRTNADIPAASDGTSGPMPGSGAITVSQLGESEVIPRRNGSVTRIAYNLAAESLPADSYYIAVEDSFGKLWIIVGGSTPAATHIITASGTVFGMGTDSSSGLPIFATDLSVSSDTVGVYRTVAVEAEVEQTGGNE